MSLTVQNKMKKIFIVFGLISFLGVNLLSADALKNSLNNILNTNDSSSGMVNLNGVNINGKPKRKIRKRPTFKSRSGKTVIGHYDDGKSVLKKEADKYIKKVTKGKIKDIDRLPKKQRLIVLKDLQKMYTIKHFKSRSATAVVATVNGREIHKKEADTFLSSVTAGQVKDFDRLPKKQRLILIKDLAKPILLKEAADKNVTDIEKETIFKQIWVEKQKVKIDVSNDEMLALYEIKKSKTLAANPQAQIPAYISLGNTLKNEILEKKMMDNLMKDVNITVNLDTNVSIETSDSNESLDKIPNTKETE